MKTDLAATGTRQIVTIETLTPHGTWERYATIVGRPGRIMRQALVDARSKAARAVAYDGSIVASI